MMQVLLRRSDEQKDIQCNVCGETFRIYWERTSLAERDAMRAVILDELKLQHAEEGGNSTSVVHPETPFNVPSWHGSPQFSGAALLGGLSTIRRVAPPELDYKKR